MGKVGATMFKNSPAFLAVIMLLPTALPVVAQEWVQGFGQGSFEAYVELGPGNQIHLSCTGAFGHPITGISFMLSGKEPEPNSIVTLIVDDNDPLELPMNDKGNMRSNSRVEAAWYEQARDALQAGNSAYVRFADGSGARFPLAGAAAAIDDCPADFWSFKPVQ